MTFSQGRTSATLLLICATFFCAGAEENLIVDGSFESAWNLNRSDDAIMELRTVEQPVKSGRKSLALSGKGQWASANSAPSAIDPLKSYRASAAIRVVKGSARLQVSYWKNHTWLGSSDHAERVTTDEWREMQLDSDPGKFAEVTRLHVAVVCDGPDIEAYVDDVNMSEIGK